MRLLGFPQEQGVVPGRLHGVGGDQDAVEGQWLQQRPEVRDLVRLAGFRNLVLGDDQAGDVGDGGEQVHLLVLAGLGELAFLAVHGHSGPGGDVPAIPGRRRLARDAPGAGGTSRRRVPRGSWPRQAVSASAFPASLPSRAVRPRGARHTRPGSRDPAPSRRGPRTGRPRIRRGPAASAACPAWMRTARRAARSAGYPAAVRGQHVLVPACRRLRDRQRAAQRRRHSRDQHRGQRGQRMPLSPRLARIGQPPLQHRPHRYRIGAAPAGRWRRMQRASHDEDTGAVKAVPG